MNGIGWLLWEWCLSKEERGVRRVGKGELLIGMPLSVLFGGGFGHLVLFCRRKERKRERERPHLGTSNMCLYLGYPFVK